MERHYCTTIPRGKVVRSVGGDDEGGCNDNDDDDDGCFIIEVEVLLAFTDQNLIELHWQRDDNVMTVPISIPRLKGALVGGIDPWDDDDDDSLLYAS